MITLLQREITRIIRGSAVYLVLGLLVLAMRFPAR